MESPCGLNVRKSPENIVEDYSLPLSEVVARLNITRDRNAAWCQTYCGLGSLEGGTTPFIRM